MTDASATSNLTTIEADAVKVFDAVLKRYVDIRSVELLDPDYVAAVEGALALKADQTAVDAALALKADQAATTAALALKADQAATTAALALKADQTAVDAALALKADQTAVDAGLALKQDSLTFSTPTEGAEGQRFQLGSGTTVKGLGARAPIVLTQEADGNLLMDFNDSSYQLAFVAQLPLKQLFSFPSGELQLLIDPALDLTMNNFVATTGITTPICRVPAGASYLAIATSAGAEMAQFFDSGAVVIDSLSSGILTSTELQTGLVYAGTLESTVTTKTNLIEPRSGSTATAFSQNVNVVGELSCTTARHDNVQAKTANTDVVIRNHSGTALATLANSGDVTMTAGTLTCGVLQPDAF